MRGGVSARAQPGVALEWSSPHAWGCFQTSSSTLTALQVFPTCVGVFLKTPHYAGFSLCLPHMRGGVSRKRQNWISLSASSPHAWGCFRSAPGDLRRALVFPTCVGVFLAHAQGRRLDGRLPHMRGGVSSFVKKYASSGMSSPHAWGCFQVGHIGQECAAVFPTCVGVFLTRITRSGRPDSLPHMRGGVSADFSRVSPGVSSSPHAWGCFC